MIVAGKVLMVESGVDACALDTRATGGDCVGRFSKVLKCSCHLAATYALSDSSFPSSASVGLKLHISASVAEMKQRHL